MAPRKTTAAQQAKREAAATKRTPKTRKPRDANAPMGYYTLSSAEAVAAAGERAAARQHADCLTIALRCHPAHNTAKAWRERIEGHTETEQQLLTWRINNARALKALPVPHRVDDVLTIVELVIGWIYDTENHSVNAAGHLFVPYHGVEKTAEDYEAVKRTLTGARLELVATARDGIVVGVLDADVNSCYTIGTKPTLRDRFLGLQAIAQLQHIQRVITEPTVVSLPVCVVLPCQMLYNVRTKLLEEGFVVVASGNVLLGHRYDIS